MVDDTKIVIDASVVLSWLVPDRTSDLIGLPLLDAIYSEELVLIAPSLLTYEVVNTLKVSITRKRIDENLALQAVALYRALKVELFEIEDYMTDIFELAQTYNISGYDAAYVWLAQNQGIKFLTIDKKLSSNIPGNLIMEQI